jgi:myo-inositol-1(or 4)-monophosphatase
MLPNLSDLQTLAYQAGEILREGQGSDLQIQLKGRFDVVTEIDHRSEEFLIRSIRARFGDHQILAEESGNAPGSPEHTWYIDPVDGTINYAHGLPIFCVSLAYAHQGQPVLGVVYDPSRDECFSAERGQGAWLNGTALRVSTTENLAQALLATSFPSETPTGEADNMTYFQRLNPLARSIRRLGSSALDQCYVAAGRLDGYWTIETSPWDIAAGTLIITEAGGVVSTISGSPGLLVPPCSLLAANPSIHGQILTVIRES